LCNNQKEKEGTTQHSCHFPRPRRGVTSTKVSRASFRFAARSFLPFPPHPCTPHGVPAVPGVVTHTLCRTLLNLQHHQLHFTHPITLLSLSAAVAICVFLFHDCVHGQHLFFSLRAAWTAPIIVRDTDPRMTARRLMAGQMQGRDASNLNSTHNSRDMARSPLPTSTSRVCEIKGSGCRPQARRVTAIACPFKGQSSFDSRLTRGLTSFPSSHSDFHMAGPRSCHSTLNPDALLFLLYQRFFFHFVAVLFSLNPPASPQTARQRSRELPERNT
jgi:hypothetical protein